MKDRYQVKFPWGSETRYGIVDRFSDEAKRLAADGKLLVADAVTPQRYAVPDNDQVVDIPLTFDRNPETGKYEGDEYHKHLEAEFAKAKALSDSLPEGVHVGKMFSLPVADGSAYYVVVKINKKTCKVEWRGFCADRWTDHHFGWGGSFPLAEVARYIEREEGLARIFRRKSS